MKAVVVSLATIESPMRHVAVTWMFARAEFVWFVTSPAMTVLPPAPSRKPHSMANPVVMWAWAGAAVTGSARARTKTAKPMRRRMLIGALSGYGVSAGR